MSPDGSPAERTPSVFRGFAHIGLGTLVSRLSGFVREVVTAAIFGAGTSMDIFIAAFTIPNLLCRILGESAVEAAFMPLFKGIHSSGDRRRAWRLASRTLAGLTIALLALVLIGVLLAPQLVRVVAHGFEGEVADATVRMTRLMFPFGLFIGLAALMGAILLAFSRFRVYSLAPVLLNVGIVAAVLTLAGRLSYVSLGIGVLIGGLLQFLVQVPFVRRLARADGARLSFLAARSSDPDFRRAAGLTGPVVVSSAVQRVGVIVDRTIASFLLPGSISSLYYSFRLVHLPYAILALAAGRAVAPVLAEHHALKRHREFRETLVDGIRMNLVFLVPVVLLAVWFARPIVGIVYQRGAFDETDLAMTSSAFALYAVGLVGMGAVFLFVRAFAARLDTKTPVKVSLAAFGVAAVLKLILVRTPLEHAGLALASSIGESLHAVMLFVALNRAAGRDGAAVGLRDVAVPAGKVALAGLALLAAVWAVDRWAGMRFADELLVNRMARVVLAGGAGVGAYLFVSRMLGLPEIGAIFRRGRRGPKVVRPTH